MALRKILTFPDPVLRETAKNVSEVTSETKTLIQDMLETMYSAKGIGLAAPQVGESLRVVVIDTRTLDQDGARYKSEEMTDLEKKVKQPLILVNPEIIQKDGKTTYEEGCLSVPGFYEEVERANRVVVRAIDGNGREFTLETDGLLAICIQHELDHLAGQLFIDRLSLVKGGRIKNQIKKHGYPPKEAPRSQENLPSPEKDKELELVGVTRAKL